MSEIVRCFSDETEVGMNVYDAMKQATPGPLKKAGTYHDGTRIEVADGRSSIGTTWGMADEANAALLAHWYNHGPKLLEALQNCCGNAGSLVDNGLAKTYPAGYSDYLAVCRDAEQVEGI